MRKHKEKGVRDKSKRVRPTRDKQRRPNQFGLGYTTSKTQNYKSSWYTHFKNTMPSLRDPPSLSTQEQLLNIGSGINHLINEFLPSVGHSDSIPNDDATFAFMKGLKKQVGVCCEDRSLAFPANWTFAFAELSVPPHVDVLNDHVNHHTITFCAPISYHLFSQDVQERLRKLLGHSLDVKSFMFMILVYNRNNVRCHLQHVVEMKHLKCDKAGDSFGLNMLGAKFVIDQSNRMKNISYEELCLTKDGYTNLRNRLSRKDLATCYFSGTAVVIPELPNRLVSHLLIISFVSYLISHKLKFICVPTIGLVVGCVT